jgi:hypothetical protein
MATGSTAQYNLPFPLSTDPVNVSGDIQKLAIKIDEILQETIEDTSAAMWTGGIFSNGINTPIYNDTTGKMTLSLSQDISASASPTFAGLNVSGSSSFSSNVDFSVIPTAPTASAGTNTTQVATTEFVENALALGEGLPSQIEKEGLFLFTNGTSASWEDPFPSQTGNAGKVLFTSGSALSWLFIQQSDVEDLVNDLSLKSPLDSPTFTGIPIAPTASAGTNTTQIATTEFVETAISGIPTETIVEDIIGISFFTMGG